MCKIPCVGGASWEMHLRIFIAMKNVFNLWNRRLCNMAAAAALFFASCTSVSRAEPDFDMIGKQFSLVLQNAHFSRARFNEEMYTKFLECYLQTLDPQHLYFTQKDVNAIRAEYEKSFGDYLLAGNTKELAQKLYSLYSERALKRIGEAEALIRAYDKKPPAFTSDRELPRTRRKLPRAADDAELDKVWQDQVEDMMLSEILRRENLAALAKEQGKPDPTAKEMSVVEKLLARLKRRRVEVQEADAEDMVSHLLNAVAHVYDPHSDYMGAREEQRFKDMIRASIVGIGAQLKAEDDGTTVVEGIVKGGPADKNGQLKLGDHIIAVAPEGDEAWTDILYLSIDKVVDLIRGQKGKPVRLRVQSADSGEEREIVIVRDEVPMSESLASAKIIDVKKKDGSSTRLGILTLPSFYVDLDDNEVHCAADVKKLLRRMNKEGVQGLVMDLRLNGGGSLEEVRKMVGFFSGAGPVVQVKTSRGNVEKLTVSGRPLFTGPLLVLTSKLSASASEIFAGAMSDYGRALIVGDERTYGKGTVQVPRSLAEFMPLLSLREGCGMIKVTIQKFYRINGSSTQIEGVASDIVLPSPTAGLQYGEKEMDYAMPYDAISPARNYVKSPALERILPQLRERSAARVAADKDLQYSNWYTEYRRRLLDENKVSLNKETRLQESKKLKEFKKAADDEKKSRYEEMTKEDGAHLVIRRLNLSDVDAAELPLASKDDKDEFMREKKDEEDELEESPEYPSGLDAMLRESLHIVNDMLELQ